MRSLWFFHAGCRGRAYDDAYQAKLANEIRVLEDQLYEADYQNRVLRDELKRARGTHSPNANSNQLPHDIPTAGETDASVIPIPVPDRQSNDAGYDVLEIDDTEAMDGPSVLPTPPPLNEETGVVGSGDDRSQPIDLSNRENTDVPNPKSGLGMPSEAIGGQSIDGGNNRAQSPSSESNGENANRNEDADDAPLQFPVPDPSSSDETLPAPVLPVPPAELVPPGEGQLQEDPVILGPTAPPSNDQTTEPPGRVKFPTGAKTMRLERQLDQPIPIPDHLELHDGLSGGKQFDEDPEIDGLYLVITAVDQAGDVLSLDQFDVDADLTIVIDEPNRDIDDTRVGRWDFKPDEVREFIRKTPIDGIHIPIQWQDRIPEGKDVVVHVRMAATEEEMRCQGRIQLKESIAASSWLPRG